MSRNLLALSLLVALGFFGPEYSRAEEDSLAKEEAALTETSKDPKFTATLKEKYQLTDEQIKAMQDKGLQAPHMAMAAQLAMSSGKTVDEVVAMRTDQKMGWGKIAKELGVHPGEIGHSVSSIRHEMNEEKAERKEAKAERKAQRETRKADRKEQRAERKERREERGKKG